MGSDMAIAPPGAERRLVALPSLSLMYADNKQLRAEADDTAVIIAISTNSLSIVFIVVSLNNG